MSILIISAGICVKSENTNNVFDLWQKSQVVIYTIEKWFSVGGWMVEGKCFGTLINKKFALTLASCVLETDSVLNKAKNWAVNIVDIIQKSKNLYHTFTSFNHKKVTIRG